MERARQFPGQEQQVWDYLPQEPAGAGRACARPIFEEKVVDFLSSSPNVTEKKVSSEELFKEDEDDGAASAAERLAQAVSGANRSAAWRARRMIRAAAAAAIAKEPI